MRPRRPGRHPGPWPSGPRRRLPAPARVTRTELIRGLGAPPGRLVAGTSGFAYPAWAPRFYPPALGDRDRLPFYAARLGVVELNNTFYQRPTAERIATWTRAVPPDFRFVVKAQRGSSLRALGADASQGVAWLTERLDGFGERLGAVLFRVPANVRRHGDGSSDVAVRRLLDAWPRTLPLVMEFQDPSWHVDETFGALREAGAILCTTELQEDETVPDVRVTGTGLYLRLRRDDYSPAELGAWAARLRPFLDAGHPAFVFFRHDETGRATELATALADAVGAG